MELEKFADEFGPEMIIEVHNPKVGLKAILVIDNSSLGPGKGGIRMTSSVDVEEVFRLARAMTWKTALAEIPFGGAKSGIIADAKNITKDEKKTLMMEFGKALKSICPSKYIAAPDVYTGEEEMRWFVEGNGSLQSATGKPQDLGGIPHELGSTGFGVAHAASVACKHIGSDINKATVAIDGFGNVGSFVANHLSEWGAKIVAVSDSKGCIYVPEGIDFQKLQAIKKETGSVINYTGGKFLPNKDLFGLPVDIIIPAAMPDIINKENVDKIRAKIITEGANISTTEDAEDVLFRKGSLIVPDFVANAGGVISSYVEHEFGYDPEEMFSLIEEKITKNTRIVLDRAREMQIKPREAALEIAKERIRKTMRERNC